VITRDDDALRALVLRLSRPHPAGGKVIEHAAILAEGAGSADIFAWIAAHAGEPEAATPQRAGRGLYGGRADTGAGVVRKPLRYVFPPGALLPPSDG
jgi:hypothetical protein